MLNPYVKWTFFIVGLLLNFQTAAQERIIHFHSNIRILEDSTMEVTERLRLRVEGQRTESGIYRDWLTAIKDNNGNLINLGFDLKSVQRNGHKLNYISQQIENGIRIYLVDQDSYLTQGDYTFTLTYNINRHLSFFEDHHELHWNVTGNGWTLPIDSVSVNVTLPETISPNTIQVQAYTGPARAKHPHYRAWINADSTAEFETTVQLSPHESLEIVIWWPPGYVTPPTKAQTFSYMLNDNGHLVWGLTGILMLVVYYLLTWLRVSKNWKTEIKAPQYLPPQGYSPASMRFIHRMDYDDKTFAAAIMNLAIKGHLTISENDSVIRLQQSTGRPTGEFSPGESELLTTLFEDRKEIILDQENQRAIDAAISAHKKSLRRNYEKIYFFTNCNHLVPGISISFGILFLNVALLPEVDQKTMVGLATFWLTFWTIGTAFLLYRAWKGWYVLSSSAHYISAINHTFLALSFIAVEIFAAWTLIELAGVGSFVILITILLINGVFYYVLKAPTLAGRKLVEKIEAFHLYLNAARKDELKLKRAPRKDARLFETYLPFALALGAEQHWVERFADILTNIDPRHVNYRPRWYRGPRWDNDNISLFINSISHCLSSAIASSSHLDDRGEEKMV